MKRFYLVKLCLLFITSLLAFLCADAAGKIKVACVGDSITAGVGTKNGQTYPRQLQEILGDGYDVKNFGVSGRTVLRKGDFPYWDEKAFENAKNFNPDIVVIKLGTNDSKSQNMAHKEDLAKDFADLAAEFKGLPSKPKVYLCHPVYAARDAWGINEPDICAHIMPAIREAAKATGSEIIDLHSPTHSKPEYLSDPVHPNNYGARIMAQTIADTIRGEKTQAHKTRRTFPAPFENWNGFKLYKWRFANSLMSREAIVVEPKIPAPGKPWILRPAFFGHEPQTDIALLNLGWHVTYIDVTDELGNPRAVKYGESFHRYLVDEFGFNPKVVMEGLSRGGFYSLRFAAENPGKVSTLYLDAPVCDVFSIPMWQNDGAKKELAKKWETDESGLEKLNTRPMDMLDRLAKNNVAIISVCGDADDVVPMESNTSELEKRYKKLGGKIQVITKPGVNHHPHSLKDPAPIVDFIVKNQPGYDAKKYADFAAKQKPADENAPFEGVEHAHNARGSLKNSLLKFQSGKATVAFVGGSITEMTGWRNLVKESLQKRFPKTDFNFIEVGIGSTGSTPHAFRLENDVLDVAKPDLLFFEAAANDKVNGFKPDEQTKGVEGVVRHALKANPNMDIIILHMAFEDFNAEIFNSIEPEVVANHERVAEHYSIPTINFAKEITDAMKADRLNWHEFGGGHPSMYGHKFYMKSIDALLDKMWAGPKPQRALPHKIPQQKLDPFSYDNGRFIDIKKAKIKNGWNIDEKWQPTMKSGTRKGFVDVPMLSAQEPGAELSLKFTGTAIGIFCASGPDAGILEYSIDGAAPKQIDTCTNWSPHLYIPWVFMFEKELQDKPHTLTIKISPEKNQKSKGTAVHIRNFVVNGK